MVYLHQRDKRAEGALHKQINSIVAVRRERWISRNSFRNIRASISRGSAPTLSSPRRIFIIRRNSWMKSCHLLFLIARLFLWYYAFRSCSKILPFFTLCSLENIIKPSEYIYWEIVLTYFSRNHYNACNNRACFEFKRIFTRFGE